MRYLSVAVVAQVAAYPRVVVCLNRFVIMADETNLARKLKSDDLVYKKVMTNYNMLPGTEIYEIAGRLYTKEKARYDGALYWQDLQRSESFWSAQEAQTATAKRSSNFADEALPNAPGSSSAALPQ